MEAHEKDEVPLNTKHDVVSHPWCMAGRVQRMGDAGRRNTVSEIHDK